MTGSLAPTGVKVLRSELPAGIQQALQSLAEQYDTSCYEQHGEGQARRLAFPDGTIWFPHGLEKDSPAVYGALALGVASLALLMLGLQAWGDGRPSRYWLPLLAVCAMVGARFFWRVSVRRRERAVANVAMGTVAMPDDLVLVAYDDAWVIPKDRIQRFEAIAQRTAEHRTTRLYAIYTDDLGETQQRYVGFLHGSAEQKAQLEQVQATLTRWLESEA